MHIVVLGANGQVASEVVLILAETPDVKVTPVARSRGGSAFLRYHGQPVVHGRITEPNEARRIQRGADIIANFALAVGSPAESIATNEAIIRQTFDSSPSTATIVFFSTLAVREQRGSKRTLYGKLKLRNEQQVLNLARRNGRRAYVLRLGHVAGQYQNISLLCREELSSLPVVIPDPERLSNVVHTATVADALVAIGSGRAAPPGLYDLVNVPQWTWREVYSHEASIVNVPLVFQTLGQSTSPPSPRGMGLLKKASFAAVRSLRLKERLMAAAGSLPISFNNRLRAEYLLDSARREIAALQQPQIIRNRATEWPALDTRGLPGLTPTQALLATIGSQSQPRTIKRWPADFVEQVEQGNAA